MGDVTDLNRLRVERAKSSADITPIMAVREVLRQMEAGELAPVNVMIVALLDEDGGTFVDIHSGGPASSNEFTGILFRATNLMAKV